MTSLFSFFRPQGTALAQGRSFSRQEWKTWWLLCLPALLLGGWARVTLLARWGDGFSFGPDAEGYWQAVYGVFNSGGFDVSPKRPWGYPALQLLSQFGPVSPGFTGALIQHAIGLLAIFPLAAILRRLIPEWRWFLVPVTVVFALDPLLNFWEHIAIADSSVVTFALAFGWASVVYWQRPSWKILLLALFIIFLTMAIRPVGRTLWAGLLPVIVLAPVLPWKKRALHVSLALIFIFPAIRLTKVRQGDDLLFGSVLPFVKMDGEPHAAIRRELSPQIREGRANLWEYVRTGQKEVFLITLGTEDVSAVAPELAALKKDRPAFARVRKELAREAIFSHPLGCLQITALKLISVWANDPKQLRIRPARFLSIHHKFLVESLEEIGPGFPAWYLRDPRAIDSEGIRTVLTERIRPGPVGQFYATIFPYLERFYHLYHLPDASRLTWPEHPWPLLLMLVGIVGWWFVGGSSALLPLLFINGAYLALTYGVGRAVQRYRLPTEYFAILAVFLGVLVIWRIFHSLQKNGWRWPLEGIQRRAVFFALGGLVSYGLNLVPYKLLTLGLSWAHFPAYAVSLTFVTGLMFFWNYRINFPTPEAWAGCAGRYLSTTAGAWIANFLAVAALRHLLPVELAIFIVGFLVALCKFLIYHRWVFPHRQVVL